MAETSHEIKQFPYTSHTVVRGKIDLRETLFTAYRILNAYLGVCVFVKLLNHFSIWDIYVFSHLIVVLYTLLSRYVQ